MTINKLILSAVPLTLYQRPSRSSQCLLKQRMMEALMILTDITVTPAVCLVLPSTN